MPSVEHAAFVELVRSHPEVVPPLLTELGVPLPPFDSVTVQEPVLAQAALTAIRALLQRSDIPEAEIYIQLIRNTVERDFEKEIALMLRERDPNMKFFPALQELVDRSKAEGKREDLYMILAQRGIDLTSDQRATLDSCEDPAHLAVWVKRACTATPAADLFE